MLRRNALVTGATGFVGGNLLCRLLSEGYDVLLLVRGDKEHARDRIGRVLSWTFKSDEIDDLLNSRIRIIEGNITRPNLGMKASDYNYVLDRVTDIWHCAASVKFAEKNRSDIEEQNIAGTKSMLKIAEISGSNSFHYMSTAFVAGNRQGLIFENEEQVSEPEDGFKNPYEESKFKAERLVRKYAEANGVDVAIYRPSIIVGDSQTWKTSSLTGIYAVARVLESIVKKFDLVDYKPVGDSYCSVNSDNSDKAARIRIPGDPSANLNLVPIDYVVKAVVEISKEIDLVRSASKINSFAGRRFRVFHIVNPKPPSLAEVCDGIGDAIGIRLVPCAPDSFKKEPPTLHEKLLMRNIKMYQAYMLDRFVFDDANTRTMLERTSIECPVVDKEMIAGLTGWSLTKLNNTADGRMS